MEHARPSQTLRRDAVALDALLRQGDARWADRTPRRREHQLVLPWPEELLSQFSLRMAGHGMSISRTHMLGNPGYALQQLAHARALERQHPGAAGRPAVPLLRIAPVGRVGDGALTLPRTACDFFPCPFDRSRPGVSRPCCPSSR